MMQLAILLLFCLVNLTMLNNVSAQQVTVKSATVPRKDGQNVNSILSNVGHSSLPKSLTTLTTKKIVQVTSKGATTTKKPSETAGKQRIMVVTNLNKVLPTSPIVKGEVTLNSGKTVTVSKSAITSTLTPASTVKVQPEKFTPSQTKTESLGPKLEAAKFIGPENISSQITDLKSGISELKASFLKFYSNKLQLETNLINPGDDTDKRTKVFLVNVDNSNFYMYLEPKLTYNEAFKWCRDRGLWLLSIENQRKSDIVEKAFPLDDIEMYFTSGNDYEKVYSFVWKSTEKAFTFTNFFPTDPNNQDGVERCVTAGRHYGKLVGWFDQNCDERNRFVCEE